MGHRLRPGRRARGAARQPVPLPRRAERDRRGARSTPSSPPTTLYRRTGIQYLPFNTVFQLAAARDDRAFAAARAMLLIPDLLGAWLTGERAAERTNASTTGAAGPRDRRVGVGPDRRAGPARATLLPPIRQPGERLGPLLPAVAAATGLRAARRSRSSARTTPPRRSSRVPGRGRRAAYISCGTWGLVGVELDAPDPDRGQPGRELHERGRRRRHGPLPSQRDGPVAAPGDDADVGARRHARAARLDPAARPRRSRPAARVIDPDDPAFLPPGDMPARIVDGVRAGRPAAAGGPGRARPLHPRQPGGRVRPDRRRRVAACPAATSRSSTSSAAAPATRCCASSPPTPAAARWSRDPVEATAIGNVLVQARALGLVEGGLEELRALVRATQPVRRFEPRRRARAAGRPA